MHCAGTFTDAALDVFHRGRFTFHVFHHQVVVHFDGGFDELLVVCLYVVDHICRYVNNLVVFWLARVIPNISLLGEYVDNTHEVIFAADRQRHDKWVRSQYVTYLVYHAVEIGTKTVELVYKDQTCNF